MTLSTFATRTLAYGLQSQPAATNFAAIINAGSGSLIAVTKDRIRANLNDRTAANGIITAVEAGTALTGRQQAMLGTALRNRVVAAEIATELSA
jgi:hypothetical protein